MEIIDSQIRMHIHDIVQNYHNILLIKTWKKNKFYK